MNQPDLAAGTAEAVARATVPRPRDGLPAPIFWAGLATVLASALAFPLYQLFWGGGYVYYTNGFDESTYLNYAYSQGAQSLTRASQYAVTFLHRCGLGGGRINMGLDGFALAAFALTARAILRQLGFARGHAHAGTAALVVVPMLVLASNPVVHGLSDWVVTSGAIAWLNVPEATNSPLVRSPEPQCSLVLLALAVWVALRTRTRWPVYGVLPFLYPFVALPAGFVALACHLNSAWPAGRRGAGLGALVLAFLGLGLVAWADYHVVLSPSLRANLVPSHLPLLSLTGMVALLAYAFLRRRIEPRLRFVTLAIALSPWVASNYQLVAGYLAQPDNFEQSIGCIAVAVPIALASRVAWPRAVILALGWGVFVTGAHHTFRVNLADVRGIPPTPALIEALRDDPEHVVVDDFTLAATLSMIHPRGGSTALGFERTFPLLAGRAAPQYRCVKRQALAEQPGNYRLQTIFRYLDHDYLYGSQDFVRVTINRRHAFKPLQDVNPAHCQDPRPLPLRYFFIRPPVPAQLTK